jgi:hypothetical protein
VHDLALGAPVDGDANQIVAVGELAAFVVVITLRADPDMGMFRNADYGMQKGDKVSFEIFPEMQDLHSAAQVRLLLYHYDDFLGRQYILGTEFIVADEVGLGRAKKQFTGEDAHYELTYDVVEADD